MAFFNFHLNHFSIWCIFKNTEGKEFLRSVWYPSCDQLYNNWFMLYSWDKQISRPMRFPK